MKLSSLANKIPGLSNILRKLPIPSSVQKIVFIVETLIQDLIRCDIPKQASAMAYTTLLSIVPSLAAMFSILTLFTPILGKDSQLMATIQSFIITNLAQGTGDQVSQVLSQFIENLNVRNIGISGFAGMLITLIMLLKQIENSLNRIWLVRKERNMLTRMIYFWTFLTLGAFIASMTFGIASGFSFTSILNFATTEEATHSPWVGKLLGFLPILIFFFFLYKIGPNCKVSSMEALVGSLIASFLFRQASSLFSYYVSNFSKHAAIYGALAALPLFLFWIYICWIIILLGSVLAWRIQQGFPPAKTKSQEDENEKSPEAKIRELRLQSLMPLLVLLAIYREFSTGSGKGISGSELVKEFNIPAIWVSDSLFILENLQYIAATNTTSETETADYMTSKFFPRIPADKLSTQQISHDLLQSTQEVFANWKKNIPIDYLKKLKSIQDVLQKEPNDTTLADAIHLDQTTSKTT
ncbi:MAG: YihY family inner membrane protein [Bdellovibrionota bacterium]